MVRAMIQIKEKNKCCGCGVCKEVCPVQCIDMLPDEEGFLYPNVRADQCVACGKCEKVCPVTMQKDNVGNVVAYAARNTDEQIRKDSSSGGIFTVIAQHILDNGGAVFGAAMDGDFRVKHICVGQSEQLWKLRGSKYVQSDLEQCYRQAKQVLETGRLVLFTGTPCQIAGLYAFLGKNYRNLYTQDIICHGVPSLLFWQRYVTYREQKVRAKTQSVCFRQKTHGWRECALRMEFANGKRYEKQISEDTYMQSFLADLCLRPSCYSCVFKTKNRNADFTLADFWGVEKCNPKLDDDKGTSLVLIHSDKGRELFEGLKDQLEWEPTDFEKAISFNSAIVKSVALKPEREGFMDCLRQQGISEVQKRYLKVPVMLRLKRKIKRILRRLRG